MIFDKIFDFELSKLKLLIKLKKKFIKKSNDLTCILNKERVLIVNNTQKFTSIGKY